VPFNGTVQNLEVSCDVLFTGITTVSPDLIYDFTVLVSSSSPNSGTMHVTSPYVTTSLVSSVTFTGTVISDTVSYSATNINLDSLVVTAGDRIAIRVRTELPDTMAAQTTLLSFGATLSYLQS